MIVRLSAALAAAVLLGSPAVGAVCKTASAPVQVGALDGTVISEASGLAVSRQFQDRLYHNNDSGDGPYFYVTNMKGGATQKVTVDGFKPLDVEDLALGPCGDQTCLYLGDIGDNGNARDNVSFVVIPEKASYASVERPLRVVEARYPDGAHDAEAFAFQPNGDLYLITKPFDVPQRKAGIAQIFKLTAAQLADSSGKPQVFAAVGEIDLPWLLWWFGIPGQVVTAMDFSPDGKQALLLTYLTALEVHHDLSRPLPPSHQWKDGVDYTLIPIAKLPQAEAIAYANDGSILYDTEARGASAPIFRQSCTGD